MILVIAFLVIGILGFVKGKVNVSAKKELRGKGMYVVSTLFCLPLPLSILAGLVIGVMNVNSQQDIQQQALIAGLIAVWVPVIAAFIIAFAMAQPKEAVPAATVRGFDVQPPPPPSA